MTARDDLEARIADLYAAEAPHRAPDWVLRSALATVDTTRQRRVLVRAPWRIRSMNGTLKIAAAGLAVVALGAIGLAAVGGRGPTVVAPTMVPTPSAAATVSPTPSFVPSALTAEFTSAIHGVSISHPDGWFVDHLATEAWTTGIPFQGDAFADVITAVPGGFLLLASQSLAGKSGETWAAGIAADPDWDDTCEPTTKPTRIDNASALIVVHCDGTRTALAWLADRGYLFVLYENDELFERMLVTVTLTPELARESPAPSAAAG